MKLEDVGKVCPDCAGLNPSCVYPDASAHREGACGRTLTVQKVELVRHVLLLQWLSARGARRMTLHFEPGTESEYALTMDADGELGVRVVREG
jgi:hypothetical protein